MRIYQYNPFHTILFQQNSKLSETNNFISEFNNLSLGFFIFVCGQLKSKESSLNHPGWIGLWQK